MKYFVGPTRDCEFIRTLHPAFTLLTSFTRFTRMSSYSYYPESRGKCTRCGRGDSPYSHTESPLFGERKHFYECGKCRRKMLKAFHAERKAAIEQDEFDSDANCVKMMMG